MGLPVVAGLTTLHTGRWGWFSASLWLSGPAACRSCWPLVSGTALASLNLWPGSPGAGTLPMGGLGGTGVAGDRAYRIPGLVPPTCGQCLVLRHWQYGLGCLKEVGLGPRRS